MPLSAARLAADTLRALPRKRLSRAMGRLAELRGPQVLLDRAIDAFARYYGVDMSEAEIPSDGFPTFDAFFTRRLKPGARPIDPDPSTVVCPADGRLDDLGPITSDSTLWIKGKTYRVAELLEDEELAERYTGGFYFIVYLSPRDYHRVHAPVTGRVTQARYIGGTLFPVNDLGTEYVDGLFARNERVSVTQESEVFGVVTTVMVGAIGVGRISVSFDDFETNRGLAVGPRQYGSDAPTLDRGGELGVFHLGSTVILFLPAGQERSVSRRPGEAVRMGCGLARVEPQ